MRMPKSIQQDTLAKLFTGWRGVLGAVLLLFSGLAAAGPTAEISFPEPDLKPFINEPTTAEACIDNTGTPGSVGYQPVLELIVPAGYTVSSFSYLGTTVTSKEATGSPCASPLGCGLVSPLIPGRTRTIANGERYLTLEYPLGSFPDTQPKQCISFSLTPDAPTAVVGTPNDFKFTPIFTLGANPLNDPATDPPIIGSEQNLKVTPKVIEHTKTIIAPEKETATGKNFIRTVELTVDVAKGETVSGITVTDALPDRFQFVQIIDNAGCSPATPLPTTTTPGGTLTFNCGAITGVVGVDKTIKFSFYVPELDVSNSPILNVVNPGGGVSITNDSTASGTYSGSPVSAIDSDNITAKAHAIQKSVAVTDCSGTTISGRGPRPNDCLRYTIVGQISDYFRVNDAVLTDVLGDGQTFKSGVIPTWSVTQGGATPSDGNFVLGTDFITPANKAANGTTTLTIKLSDALIAASQDGALIGDESDSGFNSQPATYQIVFESTIDSSYFGNVAGTKPLSAGDSVTNAADVDSAVLDEVTPHSSTGGRAIDSTGTSVLIEGPTLAKSIYAVNGNTTLPNPLNIQPGQTVTYRIQYNMPFVSFENLTLTDYLPIPKLRATEVMTFDSPAGATAPAAGQWKFGPAHTAASVTGSTTPVPNGVQNTLTWSFGNVESQADSQVIDILFTVTMTTDAIADQLNLANLVQITSSDSSATASSAESVVNIKTAEPILVVDKTVRNTRVSGSSFVDSISDADAGDVIEYRITVTNTGNNSAYKIKLIDNAETLSYYGPNCTAPTVTGATGDGGDLFAGALVLTELTGDGDATIDAGEQATITYQCTIQQAAVPNASNSLDNTASVTEYYSTAGSTINLAPAGFGTLSDDATVGIQEIQSITQRITGSSVSGTTFTNNSANVNQGETLTFEIVVTLSEGTYSGFTLTDSSASTTIPIFTACGSDGFTCSGNVSGSGGTITVTGTNGSTAGTGTVTYTGTTAPLNGNGNNTASVSATNATTRTSNTINWTKVTPAWSLTKAMSPTTGAAGTPVTVTLKWRNTSATSPMFQCVITDTLPTALFDPTTATAVTTPSGYTFSRTDNVVTYTRTNTTTACETTEQTATFTVNVKIDAVTGSTYTNPAAATAKTLPSDDLNLASAGTVDGSASAPFAVTGASNAKVISATSQAFTSNPNVAIGETVTYALTFTLPKGVTNSVILADAITAGNMTDVVLESATLARSNTSLSAANNPGSINGASAGAPVSVTLSTGTPACPAANQFCLTLGDVNNSTSANVSDTYTLTVTLRIANEVANTPGHDITDQGRIYYNNAGGTQQNVSSGTQTVNVVLPQVGIAKTANPTTLSAGDTVTYVLTITNTAGANTATGFNWAFTDTLPNDLENPGGISTNPGSTGATINASFTGNVLSGTIDQLDPGESVAITYTAKVKSDTPFGKTLTNAASATTTTLSGADANERTGAGGVNNLTASTTQSVTTNTPTLAKIIVDPQTFYAIGDLVHYRLTLGVNTGTTTNLIISDTLPTAGLAYFTDLTHPTTIVPGGNITATGVPNISANPITFTFPTVTAAAAGSIVIDFWAQVKNVPGNQNGIPLTNTASAVYDNPNATGGILTITASNPPTITVGEPNLTMTKTILAGATGRQAGDPIQYQFTVKNEGATTAYQMTVSDLLPAGINNITGVSVTASGVNIQQNNPSCTSGPVVSNSDAQVVTTTDPATQATNSLTLANLCIAPGATLTVVYNAVLMDTVQAGQTLTNPVRANYASQPTGTSSAAVVRDNANNADHDDPVNSTTTPLNNYGESASVPLTVAAPIAIDKQADNNKTQATIGETVTYTLKVSVIEGVTPNVVVTDVLPTGLSYVSHTISVGQLGMTLGNAAYDIRQGAGQTVQFNLGNVSNPANANNTDDFVTLAIVARVDNSAANQSGVVLNNGDGGTVTVQYGTTTTTVIYDYDKGAAGIQGRPLAITEPVLTMTKAANPIAQALGDVVTFTVNIQNTGAATAFDLVIADTLPVGLTYVPNSASLPALDVTAAGQNLTFRISPLGNGASTSFTYQARVDTSATVGALLTNSAALTWKSLSGATGAADNGRTGADGSSGALNNYATTTSAPVTPTTSAVIDAVKTVVDLNGGLVSSGDVLEYTVVLKNTGSTTVNNVVFTDPIPANTAYVAGSGRLNGGTTDISFSDPTLTATVGTLAANATATITFQVTINSGVPAGTVISNQGVVDSDQTVPEPTDVDGNDANGDQPTEVTVGQPVGGSGSLYAQKTVSPASVATGGQVTYTVTLTNTSAAALTNVQFSDTVPAQIEVTDATIDPVATLSRTGQVVTATLASLAPSATATITITGAASATLGAFNNQGSVTYTDGSTPRSTLTDFDGIPGNGNQPTPVTITSGSGPQLDMQKRWSLFTDTALAGVPSPGDTLLYTITIKNVGAATAEDVRFSDPVPTNTQLVVGSVVTSQGAVTSTGANSPVTVNLGDLAAGATATVSFRVTINANTADGTVLSNQATATRTGDATGVKSDDNGDSSDGINPTLTPVYTAAAPPALAKTVTATSETGSSDPSVLIGEVLTFRLAFTAPPGTTPQLTFHDTLPAGLAYVLDSARLLRASTSLNASLNPGGVNSTAADTPAILTDGAHLIQSGQTLIVALGDVTNSDATPRAYTLEYKARVQNIAGNLAGQSLSNSGTISYRNTLGIEQSLTPDVETLSIIEPTLTLDKQVNPAALLSTGGATTYTLVVTNTGGGPAYDVCITDPLTSWTVGTVTFTPSGATAPTGITLDDAACGSDKLRVSVGVFPAGGILTLTVPVSDPDLSDANGVVNNTATTTWTSLPGATGSGSGLDAAGTAGSADGERTGAGSGVNLYTVSDSAQVTVNQLNLTKTVDSTIRYAIGDPVTYRLDVSVPAGYTVNNAVLTDQLPAGLVYVGPVSRTDSNTALTTAPPLTESASGDPETLTITLGTISNTDGTAQTLSLVYTVRVANVLGNQADTAPLNNIVTLVFNDPGDNDAQKTRSANGSIELGEPDLTLTLNAAGPGGGTLVGLQAGDEITYTLVLSNASGDDVTTAFDTVLSSALPAGLIGVVDSLTNTASQGLDPAARTAILNTLSVNGGGLSTAAGGFDLPPGSSLTLTFKANLSTDVLTGQTILATPAEATYTSRDGDDPNERTGSDTGAPPVLNDYRATANSQPITVNSQVAFDKQFLPDTKTSFAIGEEVTYRLKVSLIEGATNSVVVTDTLPAGLSYVRYALGAGPTDSSMTIPFDPTTQPADLTITPATGPSATGQVVVFNLGDITNKPNSDRTDDYLTIDLTARVDNVIGNQAGTQLGNHAQLDYVNADGAQTLNFDANGDPGDGVQPLELTVIEPVITLGMTKSADTVSLGDTVTFTLTLSASGATAYGLQLVDTLPPGLDYVSATGLTPTTVNGQILTFDLAQLAQSGSSVITITARMRPDAVVDQSQTNQATVVWGSIPGATGAETNGRTGSGEVNDYTTTANASVTPTTNAAITAAKTVVIATDVNNNGKADARDTLEYTVVLNNTGNSTVNNVVFTDPIPANTTYDATNPATTTVGSITTTGNPVSLITATVGSLATNAAVTITFRVKINAGVSSGAVISNQGSVDSNETVPTPTNRADVRVGGDLAAGALYAQKTVAKVGAGSITNGDTVEYTLTLQNTGSAWLTNVSLIDALPTGLSYVDQSAVTATGTLTVVNGFITWTVGNLAARATVTATFRAKLDDDAVPTDSSRNFSNQATVTYTDPANKPQVTATDSNGVSSDGNQPTVFTAVNGNPPQTRIDVQKRWGLAIDADGNGLPSVGDTLRYTLTVTNSSTAPASDVRLTDAIPANTTVVAGSVTTTQGNGFSSNPVEVNLGTLAAGQTVTVSFEVTINTKVATNTVISNQASVTTTELGQTPAQSNITLTTVINRQHQPANIPTLSPAALLGFITMLLWLLRSTTRARCAPLGGKRRDG